MIHRAQPEKNSETAGERCVVMQQLGRQTLCAKLSCTREITVEAISASQVAQQISVAQREKPHASGGCSTLQTAECKAMHTYI